MLSNLGSWFRFGNQNNYLKDNVRLKSLLILEENTYLARIEAIKNATEAFIILKNDLIVIEKTHSLSKDSTNHHQTIKDDIHTPLFSEVSNLKFQYDNIISSIISEKCPDINRNSKVIEENINKLEEQTRQIEFIAGNLTKLAHSTTESLLQKKLSLTY